MSTPVKTDKSVEFETTSDTELGKLIQLNKNQNDTIRELKQEVAAWKEQTTYYEKKYREGLKSQIDYKEVNKKLEVVFEEMGIPFTKIMAQKDFFNALDKIWEKVDVSDEGDTLFLPQM